MAMSRSMPRTVRRGMAVSLAVGLAGILWINVRTVNPETFQLVRRAHLSYLLLACAATALAWVAEAWRVQLLLRLSGEAVPLRRLLRIVLATFFAAGVTPFSSGQGPVQVYLLHREGASVGRATAVLTLRLFLTLLTFTAVIPFLLIALRLGIPGRLRSLVTGAVTVSVFAAAVFAAFLRWPHPVARSLHALAARVSSRFLRPEVVDRLLNRLVAEADEFTSAIGALDGSRWSRLLLALGLTLLHWLCYFGIAPLLLLAFGRAFSPLKVMALQAVFSFLLSAVPVPGGSGLAEMGFAQLFAHLLPSALVGVFVSLWRGLTYYLSLLLGAVSFLGLLRRDYLAQPGGPSKV